MGQSPCSRYCETEDDGDSTNREQPMSPGSLAGNESTHYLDILYYSLCDSMFIVLYCIALYCVLLHSIVLCYIIISYYVILYMFRLGQVGMRVVSGMGFCDEHDDGGPPITNYQKELPQSSWSLMWLDPLRNSSMGGYPKRTKWQILSILLGKPVWNSNEPTIQRKAQDFRTAAIWGGVWEEPWREICGCRGKLRKKCLAKMEVASTPK